MTVRLLGVVFILSSAFKWVGLRTFAVTVELFVDYLGLDFLRGHGLLLAGLVCTGELVLGIMAFVPKAQGCSRWLMLVAMLFFTALTLANYADRYGQIESCGCFGEVIHLTPAESFYKNVALLAVAIFSLVSHCFGRKRRWCEKRE